MKRVTPLNVKYRGFEIGYSQGVYGGKVGYTAAWISSTDTKWHDGHIVVDAVGEIEQLAKECIDFNYKVEAREAELGRKLTMEEITPDM